MNMICNNENVIQLSLGLTMIWYIERVLIIQIDSFITYKTFQSSSIQTNS